MTNAIDRVISLKKGETLDEFTIAALMGKGVIGNALTYSSSDNSAIKLYIGDMGASDMRYDKFKTEASMLKTLKDSPYVLDGVTDFREKANHQKSEKIAPYYAMELMDGDLEKLLFDPGINIKAKLNMAIQITKGMSDCHHKKICHRDLYSPNILYRRVGAEYLCKIADFGSAKLHGKKQVSPYFHPTGNAKYTSPEALVGLLGGDDSEFEILTASDVFALGLLIYEIITGYKQEAITKALRIIQQMASTEGMWSPAVTHDDRKKFLINRALPRIKAVKPVLIGADDILGSESLVPDLNELIVSMVQLDYNNRHCNLVDVTKKLESMLKKAEKA